MFGYYLELALRSLKRNKVLTTLMVLAISVGIGTSMTTLTVMHLLSRDPLPGRSAQIFYPQVNPDITYPNRVNPPDVMDYRSAMDLWSAHRADRQTLIVDSELKVRAPETTLPPMMKSMLSTTTDFFSMFNVPFQYGGAWSEDDDTKHARVVVISADLNGKLFAGANSVGRTIRLRDTDVRIVGVLAPWRPSPLFYMVRGGSFAHGDTADFYSKPHEVMTPLTSGLEINDGHFQQYTCWRVPDTPGHLVNSPCEWVTLWVQINDPAKVSAYRQFVADYAQQQKTIGRFNSTLTRMFSMPEWMEYNRIVPSDVRLQTWLAFAFLTICLFNTVGLLLAKFLRRSGEITVRRALGATRRAVIAQCLVEAGMIGLLGGLGGWVLTLLGLWWVRQQPVAYADLAHLDVSMFVVTFVLAVVVSLLAGAIPAVRAGGVAPAMHLKTL
ncbi:putative ABC transport system permease protein [Luteibacter sp. Sphag1AF]|uniref:ABC transporter permease n=1 Tax=Luteibacter sp. Sphag1AF TaxID=2587031 RepID=UPI001622882F|nr:ABC transporter permease [Luteibacter sp. Sphag1AF]MBB3226609.1 putative ABC transport system permease protein [Luteibacter sp. Sphag1AF]